MGYDIEKLSGYLTPYPCEPAAPNPTASTPRKEYAEAVKAYENRVEAHRDKCADITAKARQEKSHSTYTIGRNDVTLDIWL